MSDITNKSEKIASAIYLITGFFDDKEPLKWRLRNLSADFISNSIKDKNIVAKEVLALFRVAKTAGLVSDMNYDILSTELIKLEDETKKPLELMFSGEMVIGERNLPKPRQSEYIKDNIVSNKSVLQEFGAVSVKKNSRQSIIIGLLKRKKEIMIKDVSPLISGCSEKTIQRELSSMVQAGILKKTGEKRWSRYSLA